MASPYLEDLISLLDQATPDVAATAMIECRHFFGGAAAYADGRIFMTWTKVGLALKLPEAARDILMGDGGTPLHYFPKGRVKKDYVVLPENMAADGGALAEWIVRSTAFVATLPPPRKPNRRP